MRLDRLHLRLRIFLFFAFLALAGIVIFGIGLWLGSRKDSDGFVFAGIIGGFGLLGLVTWVWYLFDLNLAQPMQWLAGALLSRAHSDVADDLDPRTARYLGDMVPAAREVTRNLAKTRDALADTVAKETTRLIEEKERLVAVTADVPFGMIVCSGSHRIAFYNGVAAELLDQSDHHPGLNHLLFDYIAQGPVLDAYNRLCSNEHGEDEVLTTLVSTCQGGRTLNARMRLVHAVTEFDRSPSYVLTIDDVTQEMELSAKSAILLSRMFAGLRPRVGTLRSALALRQDIPALKDDPEYSEAICEATFNTLEQISTLAAEYDATRTDLWPMENVTARQFVSAVHARLGTLDITVEGDETVLLHIASLPLIELVSHLAVHLAQDFGGRVLSLLVSDDDGEVTIALGWSGEALPYDILQDWLGQEIDFGVPGVSAGAVLRMHGTDCWPEFGQLGRRVLKIPLPEIIGRKLPMSRRGLAYDFDLLTKPPSAELVKAPLKDLTYVVFDTETTGLLPSQGDEICQIAALRVVNQKVVSGEKVDLLVNPGRPIPRQATDVHHITDAMVADAPKIDTVGRTFHSFARNAVLVAHNAPFDMAFLKRHEKAIGAEFTNPVLDTVLLSAVVFGQDAEHTLDAICDRLGIVIPANKRHTAMGDTIATAEAFVRMVAMCDAKGIRTFGDMIAAARTHKRLIQDLNHDLDLT